MRLLEQAFKRALAAGVPIVFGSGATSAAIPHGKQADQFKYYNSFAPLSAEINCIDEGLPGGYHLAGAGILLGVDDAAKAAKKVRVVSSRVVYRGPVFYVTTDRVQDQLSCTRCHVADRYQQFIIGG